MSQPSRPNHRSRAFTLVEVMISVAIVLLLVAGINLIFGIATKTVGATQAMNLNSRNNQAAQLVMTEDFRNCVTDVSMPYLIIYSKATPAFRNLEDMQSDRDFDATVGAADTRAQKILTTDLDNNNTEGETTVPGEVISPITVNNRNHRTDIITFFSRGRNYRRTGNPGTYQASQYSDESLIWYGHLALPDNSGTFTTNSSQFTVEKTAPGAGTFGSNNNPNNVFASQWILGRQAILLSQADGSNVIRDSSGVAQNYIYDEQYWQPNTASGSYPNDATLKAMEPLQYGSPALGMFEQGQTTYTEALHFNRYDLASTSIDLFRTRLSRYLPVYPDSNWWSRLMASDNMRYCADPFVSKPLTSAEFAKTSPMFLANCSQFIVEFAGDFLSQGKDLAGNLLSGGDSDRVYANVPDGQIDYVCVRTDPTNPSVPPVKQIRWYGFPRNTSTVNDKVGVPSVPGTRSLVAPYDNDHDSRLDVVPVRDVALPSLGTPATAQMSFEHHPPSGINPDLDPHNILNQFAAAQADYETAGVLPNSYYVCAWGPNDTARPSLIRITLTLDDPNGRLPDGSTFQYIFHVKN